MTIPLDFEKPFIVFCQISYDFQKLLESRRFVLKSIIVMAVREHVVENNVILVLSCVGEQFILKAD